MGRGDLGEIACSTSVWDERIEVPEVERGSISFLGFSLWLGVGFALAGVLWLAALFAPRRTVGRAVLGGGWPLQPVGWRKPGELDKELDLSIGYYRRIIPERNRYLKDPASAWAPFPFQHPMDVRSVASRDLS